MYQAHCECQVPLYKFLLCSSCRVIFLNMLSIMALLSSGPAVTPFCSLASGRPCNSIPHACNPVFGLGCSPLLCLPRPSRLCVFTHETTLCPVHHLNPTRPLRPESILRFLHKTLSTHQTRSPSCDPWWQWFLLITRDSVTFSWSVSLIYELEGSTVRWKTRLYTFFFISFIRGVVERTLLSELENVGSIWLFKIY